MDGLAQKAFASTTFLKRLLAKFRQLRTQVDPSNDTAVQNMLDIQGETTRVRADYTTLHEFYWSEARRLQEQLDAAHHRRQRDLCGVLAEHELETWAHREEVGELRSQVENLRLLGRTRSSSRRLNVPKLTNFLNRDQTWVNDNWRRLKNLLERFRDGIAPEKSWSTLIAITAVDDPFAQGSPFATLAEDDSDEEEQDQSGDQGDSTQGKTAQGGKDNEVDLTHQDSGASEPSSRKTTPTEKKRFRGSSRKVPDQPQLRPSGWAPSADQARSPSNQLMFQESDAREIMKNEPVAWDTLRPDVIMLMRAGIGYQGSIAMLSGDVMTHNLFPPSALADMLANMMFWNRLDESFWTKEFAPDWPDLVDADVRVAQKVMDDVSSEHDDTQHDANYNPDDDVDNQDDDDVQGGDSVLSVRNVVAPPFRRTLMHQRPSPPLRSLTVADTEVVEVPGPGISSWRHYGILMTFAPSSTHAVHQSAGFPDYTPNKAGGIQSLKQRFILADVQALLATAPWTIMFENRVKRLVLLSYSALAPRGRMALDKYIRFMEENASGFWHGGHWFAIDTSTQGGADMQRERKRQWDALARTVETKQRECVAEGVPSTIFWEATYWSLPSKPCYWILMNPRSLNSQGNPYSLAEQLDT
ncbi:hypothetical protein PHMEG_00013901 [Phytophthora megakarya]|uniref:Uncharacterized protein n=1 Tax=Phytophthora megakarya TaxID=4795 RepID=A0A225W5L4_9STRA|nr:hypothetical protein PHMEG_00013901 [Phytophthora megakarya]